MEDLAEIVARLRDAVIVLDREKKVTAWLGAAEQLFGWAEQEVRGRNIEELLRPRDTNDNPTCIGPCGPIERLRIATGMPEHEALVTTKNGASVWIGVTAAFDRDDQGRIARTVIVARNISRRKTIDLAKSEVISAVSHELRSPLTSVKGFTKTLLARWDRFDDETKKHMLVTIESDADRVTRLITELLDISRLESGRLQLRRKKITIPDIANQVVARIQPRSNRHAIHTDFADGFPEVFADPDKVEQVLTNLVENAVKYTEEGKIAVTGVVDDGLVRVSVSDQGEGIPADQRVQVFGKFFRHGERAHNPTGTGLGLYISKGLVEAHGGRIWIEDAPDGGSVFSFTLPISEPG